MKTFILTILLFITSILSAQSSNLTEFQNKLNTYKEGDKINYLKISNEDKNDLFNLYTQLSNEEKQQLDIAMHILDFGPLPYVQPTDKQMNDWLNSKQFGVWIDGKRISNSELKNFKNTDFSQTFVSKLRKNAKNFGKHYYQIDLMTNAYYENYIHERKTKKIIAFTKN